MIDVDIAMKWALVASVYGLAVLVFAFAARIILDVWREL